MDLFKIPSADEAADRLVAALLELGEADGGIIELAPLLSAAACAVTGADGAVVQVVDGADVRCVGGAGLLAGTDGVRVRRDGSLAGLVIATSTAQVSARVDRDTRVDHVSCERLGIAAMAIAPIRHLNQTTAVLTLAGRDPASVSREDLRLIEPLTRAASTRLAHAETAEVAAGRLTLLDEVTAASKDVLLADDPGQELVEAMARIVGASYVLLLLPDASGGLRFVRGIGADLSTVRLAQDGTSLAGSAFVSGRAQIVPDWLNDPRVSAAAAERMVIAGASERARAGAFIPLETSDGPAGVVVVLLPEPITARNADLLGLLRLLAAEAGVAISRHEMRRTLAAQARTDPLTGAANRRVWVERCELEVERAARTGMPLTVAMLDLDYFKRYNDRLGHPAGDELLRQATQRWAVTLRPTDLLARLGGEEFGVLLPDADIDAATGIVERLRAVVPFGQTVSIGLSGYRQGEDISSTVHRADQALYAAKAGGRDQVAAQ